MRLPTLALAGLACLTLACAPKSAPSPAPGPEAAAQDGSGRHVSITLAKGGGSIELELYPELAPITVANFVKLANAKFYDGLSFHRVEPGFVVQGGDPQGNGMGGPGWHIKGEFTTAKKHIRGTLAMARAQDPDSAGSQFYICLGPAPFLDGQYAIFGQVLSGMDLVDDIRVGDKIASIVIKP